MLDVQKTRKTKVRGFRLTEKAEANLTALAEEFGVSEPKILNALLEQHAEKILAGARAEKAGDKL